MDAEEGNWRTFDCPTCKREIYLWETKDCPVQTVLCGGCSTLYEITRNPED